MASGIQQGKWHIRELLNSEEKQVMPSESNHFVFLFVPHGKEGDNKRACRLQILGVQTKGLYMMKMIMGKYMGLVAFVLMVCHYFCDLSQSL